MSASTFFAPSLSLLGPGALRRLGPIIAAMPNGGAKTALVITGDRRFDVTGVIPELTRMLNRLGTKVEVYDEIEQNPTIQHVQAALIMAEEIDADCVVSVGGGSCHDCAKLVRGLFRNAAGQTTVEELEGVDMLLSAPSVPHFAVSTTATSGSSSELSRLAIIDDPIAKTEMSVIDHALTPTVACVVTASSQGRPELIASSGILALSHAIEAYLSPASSPVTDAAALHSIRLVSSYLRRAVTDPDDHFSRDMISYASYLAGLSFNSAGLGWTVAMGNAVCALNISVPVSECAGVLLPHVLEFYGEGSESTRELFVDLAEAVGCPDATPRAAVSAVILAAARLVADVKLPETMHELTARRRLEMHRSSIPEMAAKAIRDPASITAARSATLGDVENLFCASWDTTKSSNAECASVMVKPSSKEKSKMSWVQRYNALGKYTR